MERLNSNLVFLFLNDCIITPIIFSLDGLVTTCALDGSVIRAHCFAHTFLKSLGVIFDSQPTTMLYCESILVRKSFLMSHFNLQLCA